MDKHIFIILQKFYNKNRSLPPDGKMLVAKNIVKYGDLLDYYIETKNSNVKVTYNYYEDSTQENNYISSHFTLIKT